MTGSGIALGIDAYQLSTMVAHADLGRAAHRVAMAFFFRKMPRARGYVVFCGLRQLLDHAAALRFTAEDIEALRRHPVLGPALGARPELARALAELDGFVGDVDALPEGTLAFAGAAVRTDGAPLEVAGTPLRIYVPLVQVRTDMLRAKLIETPWLGYLNHLSMVASKAARVVDAAGGKPVLEFGSRRTHPSAAIDAAYAAHVAGCSATSNLAAYARYGVPAVGTMDHFAIQASEEPGVAPAETERAFFSAFARVFPANATMLVDTYDTARGLRHAAQAAAGAPFAVRIDSNVTVASVCAAREELARHGAGGARIFVSDGLDEERVAELRDHVDGFGVGENVVCAPDSPVGVGAVAKLTVNGYGKVTMKLAKGSGKATLPGELQVHRYRDHDLVALADEAAPPGGSALLAPVWRGDRRVAAAPTLAETRAHVRAQIEALPEGLRARAPRGARTLVASDGLVATIERLVKEAER